MDVIKCFSIHPYKFTDGDLGIEIEVEGSNLPEQLEYWNVEYDGSLVGESREYVLKKPLKVKEIPLALDELRRKYVKCESTVNDSVRCGIHIHVNVQKLTMVQLYNFFTLYSMFEGVLLGYCGKGRDGNLFCLPLNKSPLLINIIRHCAEAKEFGYFHDDEYRYCAMNVKSLGSYGSLEFRSLLGGSGALERTEAWASLLLHLRDVACMYEDPTQLIRQGSIQGYYPLFKRLIGSHITMFSEVDNKERKLVQGIRAAQAIAYSCDWATYIDNSDPYVDFC